MRHSNSELLKNKQRDVPNRGGLTVWLDVVPRAFEVTTRSMVFPVGSRWVSGRRVFPGFPGGSTGSAGRLLFPDHHAIAVSTMSLHGVREGEWPGHISPRDRRGSGMKWVWPSGRVRPKRPWDSWPWDSFAPLDPDCHGFVQQLVSVYCVGSRRGPSRNRLNEYLVRPWFGERPRWEPPFGDVEWLNHWFFDASLLAWPPTRCVLARGSRTVGASLSSPWSGRRLRDGLGAYLTRRWGAGGSSFVRRTRPVEEFVGLEEIAHEAESQLIGEMVP